MNSKCAEAGPALGSCTVVKIDEFFGSLSQPSWFPVGRPSSPVWFFFHRSSCCAAKIGSFRLSRVFVELTVNDDATRG